MGKKTDSTDAKENKRFVTRKVFRELCGHNGEPLPYYTLTSDIRRGNVIESEDRTIDIENSINAKYIEKKKHYELTKAETNDTDQEKKRVELLKAKRELEMKDFALAKMRGEYIPKELVKATFKAHFKEVYQQFFFASEQILTDYASKFGGKKEDLAKLKGDLTETINKIIEKGRESSRQKIKQIEEEYSANHVKT